MAKVQTVFTLNHRNIRKIDTDEEPEKWFDLVRFNKCDTRSLLVM